MSVFTDIFWVISASFLFQFTSSIFLKCNSLCLCVCLSKYNMADIIRVQNFALPLGFYSELCLCRTGVLNVIQEFLLFFFYFTLIWICFLMIHFVKKMCCCSKMQRTFDSLRVSLCWLWSLPMPLCHFGMLIFLPYFLKPLQTWFKAQLFLRLLQAVSNYCFIDSINF